MAELGAGLDLLILLMALLIWLDENVGITTDVFSPWQNSSRLGLLILLMALLIWLDENVLRNFRLPSGHSDPQN